MFQNLTGWHALIILAIVLLVFGAAKLPALARSVGQSVRILKTEAVDNADQVSTADTVPSTVPNAATASSSRASGIVQTSPVAVDVLSR